MKLVNVEQTETLHMKIPLFKKIKDAQWWARQEYRNDRSPEGKIIAVLQCLCQLAWHCNGIHYYTIEETPFGGYYPEGSHWSLYSTAAPKVRSVFFQLTEIEVRKP